MMLVSLSDTALTASCSTDRGCMPNLMCRQINSSENAIKVNGQRLLVVDKSIFFGKRFVQSSGH